MEKANLIKVNTAHLNKIHLGGLDAQCEWSELKNGGVGDLPLGKIFSTKNPRGKIKTMPFLFIVGKQLPYEKYTT